MELRHLRYFVAVAEELHFRRAAERLHMSQPPLSQQIRALERDIGATLLVRNQRRVELTDAGAAFLVRAREILDEVEDAAREARRVQRGEVGRLTVGFVGSAIYAFVPELLRAFREQSPDIVLRLFELGTSEQLRQLDDGRLDVGFLRGPVRSPGLTIETVLSEPMIVALPDTHPLAAADVLELPELRGEPLVLLTRTGSPGVRAALAPALELLGGEEVVAQEVTEMQTVIALVAAGVGLSLVPESLHGLARDGVTYRPLAGEDVPVMHLAMAWRTGAESPVLATFLEKARVTAPAEGERGQRGPSHK